MPAVSRLIEVVRYQWKRCASPYPGEPGTVLRVAMTVIAAVLLNACVPTDAIIYVIASIRDESDRPFLTCEGTLLDDDLSNIDLRLIHQESIPSDRLSRLVPPRSINYARTFHYPGFVSPSYVLFSCDDAIDRVSIRINPENRPGSVFDLGTVRLRRQRSE
jgi:hypothetical protein